MAILSILLTVVIIAVSILMVMVVLVQRPKQEGLGAAFGGGAFDSALGAHTTDILQKLTTWLGVIFFVSAIGLAMVKTRQFRDSAANDLLEEVNKDAQLPTLPPELSNLPGLEGLAAPAPAEAPAPAPAKEEAKPVAEEKPAAPAAPEAAKPALAPAKEAAKPAEPKPAEAEQKPAAPEAAKPAPAPAQPAAPASAPAAEAEKAKE
ncbi:MAG TPA: preprotein translocase subunit SecG [Bacteroidia bacterium]|nr:preprotein translocase subunit SecG [Bacteroidia bacterium]